MIFVTTHVHNAASFATQRASAHGAVHVASHDTHPMLHHMMIHMQQHMLQHMLGLGMLQHRRSYAAFVSFQLQLSRARFGHASQALAIEA